jgi:hypothetical protein
MASSPDILLSYFNPASIVMGREAELVIGKLGIRKWRWRRGEER